MTDELTEIDVHSVDLTERILNGFRGRDSRWSRVQSEERRSNEVGDIPEGIGCLYSEKRTLRVSGGKCITVASIVGGRSGYGRDTGSIIELENDRILVHACSAGHYSSGIPSYIDHISIFLNTAYNGGKHSGSDDRTGGIFGDGDGGTGGIIGFVGFVVGRCYDGVGLSVYIGSGRSEGIRPVRIIVRRRGDEKLLESDPSRTVPPGVSFFDLDADRTNGGEGVGRCPGYRQRATQVRPTRGRYRKYRIYRISDECHLGSRETISDNIVCSEFELVIISISYARCDCRRQIIDASGGSSEEVPDFRTSSVGSSIEVFIGGLIQKRIVYIPPCQICITEGGRDIEPGIVDKGVGRRSGATTSGIAYGDTRNRRVHLEVCIAHIGRYISDIIGGSEFYPHSRVIQVYGDAPGVASVIDFIGDYLGIVCPAVGRVGESDGVYGESDIVTDTSRIPGYIDTRSSTNFYSGCTRIGEGGA